MIAPKDPGKILRLLGISLDAVEAIPNASDTTSVVTAAYADGGDASAESAQDPKNDGKSTAESPFIFQPYEKANQLGSKEKKKHFFNRITGFVAVARILGTNHFLFATNASIRFRIFECLYYFVPFAPQGMLKYIIYLSSMLFLRYVVVKGLQRILNTENVLLWGIKVLVFDVDGTVKQTYNLISSMMPGLIEWLGQIGIDAWTTLQKEFGNYLCHLITNHSDFWRKHLMNNILDTLPDMENVLNILKNLKVIQAIPPEQMSLTIDSFEANMKELINLRSLEDENRRVQLMTNLEAHVALLKERLEKSKTCDAENLKNALTIVREVNSINPCERLIVNQYIMITQLSKNLNAIYGKKNWPERYAEFIDNELRRILYAKTTSEHIHVFAQTILDQKTSKRVINNIHLKMDHERFLQSYINNDYLLTTGARDGQKMLPDGEHWETSDGEAAIGKRIMDESGRILHNKYELSEGLKDEGVSEGLKDERAQAEIDLSLAGNGTVTINGYAVGAFYGLLGIGGDLLGIGGGLLGIGGAMYTPPENTSLETISPENMFQNIFDTVDNYFNVTARVPLPMIRMYTTKRKKVHYYIADKPSVEAQSLLEELDDLNHELAVDSENLQQMTKLPNTAYGNFTFTGGVVAEYSDTYKAQMNAIESMWIRELEEIKGWGTTDDRREILRDDPTSENFFIWYDVRKKTGEEECVVPILQRRDVFNT